MFFDIKKAREKETVRKKEWKREREKKEKLLNNVVKRERENLIIFSPNLQPRQETKKRNLSVYRKYNDDILLHNWG